MEDDLTRQHIRACEMCGSPVILAGHVTKYFIPVHPLDIEKLAGHIDAESLLHSRLSRAERIIVDLRKRVADFEVKALKQEAEEKAKVPKHD